MFCSSFNGTKLAEDIQVFWIYERWIMWRRRDFFSVASICRECLEDRVVSLQQLQWRNIFTRCLPFFLWPWKLDLDVENKLYKVFFFSAWFFVFVSFSPSSFLWMLFLYDFYVLWKLILSLRTPLSLRGLLFFFISLCACFLTWFCFILHSSSMNQYITHIT